MNRVSSIIFLLIGLSATSFAQNSVCVTIDDLPVVGYGVNQEEQRKITEDLVGILVNAKVPAVGFVNEGKLYNDTGTLIQGQVDFLKYWLDNGLELGNHTFNHLNYHRTNLEEYGKQIDRGDSVTSYLMSRKPRYFRHPFLRIGENAAKHDSLKTFLQQRGYVEAPVTIDNADYLFALAYAKALQNDNSDRARKIGETYVDYMIQMLEYFERNSMDLFGRNIPHVLLLHANRLNADYLDDLFERYQEKEYQFERLDRVLSDPAYQTTISSYGDWGISWIHRWALSQKKKRNFSEVNPLPPKSWSLYHSLGKRSSGLQDYLDNKINPGRPMEYKVKVVHRLHAYSTAQYPSDLANKMRFRKKWCQS